jgi:hypothetical protein
MGNSNYVTSDAATNALLIRCKNYALKNKLASSFDKKELALLIEKTDALIKENLSREDLVKTLFENFVLRVIANNVFRKEYHLFILPVLYRVRDDFFQANVSASKALAYFARLFNEVMPGDEVVSKLYRWAANDAKSFGKTVWADKYLALSQCRQITSKVQPTIASPKGYVKIVLQEEGASTVTAAV